MIEKWYVAGWRLDEPPVLVCVVKETEHFVTLESGRREKKADTYFDSFEDAAAFLLGRAERGVEAARRSLTYREGVLATLRQRLAEAASQ